MIEFEGKIIEVKDYVHDGESVVKVLRISTKNAPAFDFAPGQFVMISAGNVKNPSDPSRLKFSSMSICSAPHQKGFIELCIRMPKKPGVSLYLKDNAKTGEPVKVKGPFGTFLLAKEQSAAVFVATGTGIAPLMSMLRHLVHSNFAGKIFFFYGCRSKDDFLYREELFAIKKGHKNFEFYVSFSKQEPGGRIGYIQEIVKEFVFPKNPEGAHAYVCGNPVSVEQQVASLKSRGFSEKNIHFEKW